MAAPGVDVISTSRTGGYEYKSGTSMAAPHVAGVAALMAAVAPQLTAAELRAILLQHASRSGLPVGAGYVDALGAVLRPRAGTSSYQQGQPPQARVLQATREGPHDRRPRSRCSARSRRSAACRSSSTGARWPSCAAGRSPLTVRLRGAHRAAS